MSLNPKNLLLSAALLLSAPVFAQSGASSNNSDRNDMDALRRWIQDKRMVTVKELGGDLSLSCEVRTEFQDTSEINNGSEVRTSDGKPPQAWDVEVNLMIDYRTDRTWSAIKLEYDNDMGTFSGTDTKLKLEKAYAGGRLIAGDTFTWDAEVGRRYLNNVYDSKLEFASRFDGVLLRFSKAFENIGDFYATPGLIIVNDKFNHYAYATEIGALKIANTGMYLKSSAVYWYKGPSHYATNRFRYCVAQLLPFYQFYPEWFGKRLVKIYAAGLWNMMAKKLRLPNPGTDPSAAFTNSSVVTYTTYPSRQNFGWYAGLALGTVKKAGDWAVEANFQWLQAQAVPDFDASGVGRGNSSKVGLFLINQDASASKTNLTNTTTAVGNGNFYGFEVDALYAFTNNLTMEQNLKVSWTLDRDIGPDINYRQWEIEFIYAF
ncbi:MAG: hypothetical protein JSS32_01465 [Verrucomicrobia bacterium]|nr:hypothetical protein [Verrucomicrobiota bacterium]